MITPRVSRSLQLYKCYKRSDWDYTLDYWTDRQIQQALIFDETPSWDENGKAVYGET